MPTIQISEIFLLIYERIDSDWYIKQCVPLYLLNRILLRLKHDEKLLLAHRPKT